MTAYLGATVLDLTEPDRASGAQDKFERRLFEMNTQTGIRTVDAPGPADAVVRDFVWTSMSRAEVKVLRDFIDSCAGRWTPFWLMTWQRDLELSTSYVANDPSIVIQAANYAALVFPTGNYRRHLALRGDSGTFYFRSISAAVDNGNGTETLTLSASIGEAITAPGLLSFLRLARLDTDEPRIAWEGGAFAKCSLPIREIPKETPA